MCKKGILGSFPGFTMNRINRISLDRISQNPLDVCRSRSFWVGFIDGFFFPFFYYRDDRRVRISALEFDSMREAWESTNIALCSAYRELEEIEGPKLVEKKTQGSRDQKHSLLAAAR